MKTNSILHIKDDTNSFLTKKKNIQSATVRYYNNQYNVREGHKLSEYLEFANLFPCMVDDEANRTLSRLVSIEEL